MDAFIWDETLLRPDNSAVKHKRRYVCICNVLSVVSASQDAAYWKVVNKAQGVPVALGMMKSC